MFSELRRRWSIIPAWIKAIPVVGLLILLSAAHFRLVAVSPDLVPLVQRLFFLPLFMACLLFGLWGGLLCAALISLSQIHPLFMPGQAPHGLLVMSLEVGLYFFTGIIMGLLVDRERREARRLQRAENLALLGQAAAAVAHELKTPLVAIGGFAQRIQKDLDQGHPYHEQLRIIVDQVAHMENLLREMLDFTRPLELKLSRQDLGALFGDVLALASLSAKESGVSLKAELPPQGLSVLADGSRLKQVLLNLVQNAVQASPRGAEVLLRAQNDGSEVVLTVQDKGVGIEPHDLERIYFPFYTTKRGGTGLGLAICQKIVKAHGGRLSVDSRPQAGSTFQVHLPLNGPAAQAAAA
ncbi:MAG: ATP-binding protein [Thermodesulfobacteriota bacterium]